MPELKDTLMELIAQHGLEDIAMVMMDYCESKAKALEAIGLQCSLTKWTRRHIADLELLDDWLSLTPCPLCPEILSGQIELAQKWLYAAQTMELATDNISWAEYKERQGFEQQGDDK